MIDKIRSDSMDLLFEAILTLETVDDCYKFFDDLCTSIELKAFAQRLQVAKLLDEHRVYNSIVTETGASTATISRVNRSLKDGNDGYEMVFERLAGKSRQS
ncbi:MAG: TrpR-like protein, YerC/YecD [Ruminococcus sp.]|nr:TrpR-like protein, YerC/YecD [Ruminococcus sp.]